MKKLLLLLIPVMMGCDEETLNQILSNTNVPATGIGMLDAAVSDEMSKNFYTCREISAVNAFTGDTVWHYKGKARISEESGNGNVTVHYMNGGKIEKVDLIGSTMNIFSRQLNGCP